MKSPPQNGFHIFQDFSKIRPKMLKIKFYIKYAIVFHFSLEFSNEKVILVRFSEPKKPGSVVITATGYICIKKIHNFFIDGFFFINFLNLVTIYGFRKCITNKKSFKTISV